MRNFKLSLLKIVQTTQSILSPQGVQNIQTSLSTLLLCLSVLIFSTFSVQAGESLHYHLSQSTDTLDIWTAPPSVRVFKDDPLPSAISSVVMVYAAGNEFEPFQVIARPLVSTQINVDIEAFGSGIETEIHQVKYVNISQPTDLLGSTAPWPDPLWPLEKGDSVSLTADENTSFWITVKVPPGTPSGDYTTHVQLGTVRVPVSLHVFNFSLPEELHVKSQMNFSHNTILDKYGVGCCGSDYWYYVEKIKQYFIDHRLTPKSVLWSGGVTSNGGNPYIDYDCNGTLTDNDGIWGFEQPAARYLDGTGLMGDTFSKSFNGGTGFPSFMAATFRDNDSSEDPRPSEFCGVTRDADDWYSADQPDSQYNQKWFQYMTDLQDYLDRNESGDESGNVNESENESENENDLSFLDKAYYYMANEPQDQADYDAVAWYSRQLKLAAPRLKLMVSEEPKPEIYNHPNYFSSGQINIWLPVLNNYNPDISHERELNHGEETWIYWLYGTRPPFFNPITLDHPGIESRLTGWFLWKYRIRGIAYYSLNNWSKNPWTDPLNSNHNGDLFMLYPPALDNTAISLGANNHRFVPSIRFELMRDSLEDYEYLFLLNGGTQPAVTLDENADSVDEAASVNEADSVDEADFQADKIIKGVASYTRSDSFMYELRRFMGLKIGGEIETIPDIQPEVGHPRAEGAPGEYYINFQDPEGEPGTTRTEETWNNGYIFKYVNLAGHDYLQAGVEQYDTKAGFGWLDETTHFKTGRDPWGSETDERKITYAYDDYAHHPGIFEFDLPGGTYSVELSVGTPRKIRAHNRVVIEGVSFIDDEPSEQYIIRRMEVTVFDNKLTVDVGIFNEYTMLNYLDIEAVQTPEPPVPEPSANFQILIDSSVCRLLSGEITHVYGCRGVNNLVVESGANAKLINFPGSNVITIESDSSTFTISRSGATVTLQGDDGTSLIMPATGTVQRIIFQNEFQDEAFDLIIDSGAVKLGSQTVYTDNFPIH